MHKIARRKRQRKEQKINSEERKRVKFRKEKVEEVNKIKNISTSQSVYIYVYRKDVRKVTVRPFCKTEKIKKRSESKKNI